MKTKAIETLVGTFMLLGVLALIYLSLQVSGLAFKVKQEGYTVYAAFTNVGDLKPRAPVRIAGVTVGTVSSIHLNPETFKAIVEINIEEKENNLPTDTSAAILTQGLLGSNYISLEPGFDETFLSENGEIDITHPAIILEDLIGQLLFSFTDKKEKEKE